MTSIDNYGDFELPDEPSKIEVVEDPVQTITSLYDLFKKLSRDKTDHENWIYTSEWWEGIYHIALKLFKNKDNLKPKGSELEEIIKQLKINAFNYDGTGLFLSAMQNILNIKILIIDKFLNLDFPGYKLDKNKILFLGNRMECEKAGIESQGIILSNCKTEHLGYRSEGGLYINNNRSTYLGAKNGKRGIYINKKRTEMIGDWLDKHHPTKISINDGEKRDQYNELTIRLDHLIDYKKISDVENIDENKASLIKQSLNKTIQQINFLQDLHTLPYQDQIHKLKSFDFKQFQLDILKIAREVNREYRRIKN